jgi:hypothetical protein
MEVLEPRLLLSQFYVADPKGPDGIAGTADDVNASDAYPGTQAKPFATLGKGAAVAVAGDTVLIRGGVYKQVLRPQNSGTVGNPITFKAYPGETATIRETPELTNLTADEVADDQEGRQYGIYIYGRAYITLAGLTVTAVSGWARIVNSNHIVIRDGNFTNATNSGTTGSIKFYLSDDNVVWNNVIDGGNDNLLLIHSDRNLVEGNRITSGRHTLWCIRAGNFNVIRDNYFYNALQKIGEVYDAETDPPIQYDCTKHNLIQGNVFAYTPSSGNSAPYAGIQYAGQEGIIRQNVFYSTVGPALDLTLYSDEARFNTHNRVYNNDFYATSFAGISLSEAFWYTFTDNIIKNNILTKSIFVANDTRWTWYTQVLAGKPVQLMTGRVADFVFENNNLFNQAADELWLIAYGARDSSSNPPPQTVTGFQAKYPTVFRANLQADPQFVDEAGHDFHLRTGSPMIDAGAFLTKTVAAGSGTVLPVEDVRYFFDGFGICDENGKPLLGDLVQLEGDTRVARVLAIDYAANTLQLDQVLSWTAGQGVALRYLGQRPDVGAYEYAAPGNQGPIASFTAAPRVDQPLTVDFTAANSYDPDGHLTSYEWDFGDGQTQSSASATASHAYAGGGSYPVTLKVTDDGSPGLTASATVPVSVGVPILEVAPLRLDFGLTGTALTFTVRNRGEGMLVYSLSVPPADSWLTVAPATGTCTTEVDMIAVTVNRAGLTLGRHTSTITVNGGVGGTQTVSVTVEVPTVTQQTLLDVGGPWRYQKGNFTPADLWYNTWATPEFDDTAWPTGAMPIGYSNDNDVAYATPLPDMFNGYLTFYVRGTFEIADPEAVVGLELEAGYDDGFVAYINDTQVVRQNMGPLGSLVRADTEASDMHEETQTPTERFPIPLKPGLLRQGKNVLAIEVHNIGIGSSDAGIVARLNAVVASQPLRVVGVTLNQRPGRGVSAIEPSGIGVRTIEVVFNKPATFDASATFLETVRFDAGREVVTGILAPVRLTGSDTNVMTLTFDNASVVDTWVKVTLFGDGTLRDEEGQALDGEPLRGAAGPGYIASADRDLPSGDGTPGGDAVFYVGSLGGDMNGDGRVTAEDIDAFLEEYFGGDPDADFRGVGSGDSLPDGKITPSDIDRFLSIYQAAVASGSGLDPLPGAGNP